MVVVFVACLGPGSVQPACRVHGRVRSTIDQARAACMHRCKHTGGSWSCMSAASPPPAPCAASRSAASTRA